MKKDLTKKYLDELNREMIESVTTGLEWLESAETPKSGVATMVENMKIYLVSYDDSPPSLKFIMDEEYVPKNPGCGAIMASCEEAARESFRKQKPGLMITSVTNMDSIGSGLDLASPPKLEITHPTSSRDDLNLNLHYQPKVALPSINMTIKIDPV